MRRHRIALPTLALAAVFAAGGAAWAGPHQVAVSVAGQKLVVPVPPGLAVGSPDLLSAEQSAATSVKFRLVSVFTPAGGPAPGKSTRLVLVETPAQDGRMTRSEFARMKHLARANVHALATPIDPGQAGSVDAARVLVDTGAAFGWLAPVEENGRSDASQDRALTGTLYLLIHDRLLAFSLRSDRATAPEAHWIGQAMHWLIAAVRKANGTRRERFDPDKPAVEPFQAMTRPEALRAYTCNGASSMFEESELGTLERGKPAGIGVLDHDLMTEPAAGMLDTHVVSTILGGRILYHRGEGFPGLEAPVPGTTDGLAALLHA